MSFPPQLMALGVILLFVILVFWMIRTSQQKQSELDYQLRQLGYEPLETPPLELERRVEELYQTSKGRDVRLWRVHKRHGLDQDLFLFDVEDTRGESSEVGTEVFGIISSQLALPRFSLMTMPDFDRSNLFGSLMDKLLEKVMSYAEGYLGLQQIEFSDRPDLDDQVILFGRDPYAVQEMLDRVGLHILRSHELPILIAGSEDFLTVDFSSSASFNHPGQDLASRYQTFVQITRAFME